MSTYDRLAIDLTIILGQMLSYFVNWAQVIDTECWISNPVRPGPTLGRDCPAIFMNCVGIS